MSNYYDLVVQAAAENKWAEVIKIASKAIQDKDTEETFFGIKKGIFNVVYCHNFVYLNYENGWSDITNKVVKEVKEFKDCLETAKIKVIYLRDGHDFNRSFKEGTLSTDIFNEHDFVVILTIKDDLYKRFALQNLPVMHFTINPLFTKIKNTVTKKEYAIDKNAYTALLRDSKIDSIFED